MAKPGDIGVSGARSAWPYVYQPSTPVEVSVDVKVIAGGIKLKDGKRKLQFSVVFSPKQADSSARVPLATWPSAIEKLCREGLDLRVSCVPETFDVEKGRPRPDPTRAIVLRIKPLHLERREAAISDIDECWRTVIGIGDPAHKKTPWEALAYVYGAGQQAPLQSATQSGQIVGVPRGDMAILLQSWRARVVLGRLSGSSIQTDPGCDYLGALSDWVMSSAELGDMAFGDLGPTGRDEASTEQTREGRVALAAAIASQREAEGRKADEVRVRAVVGAERVRRGRAAYLSAGGSAQALRTHHEECSPGTFCDAPFAIAADITGGDSATLHKLYGTFRRLNEAQLSFDKQLEEVDKPQEEIRKLSSQPTWSPPTPSLPEEIDRNLVEPVAAVKRKLFALQAMPSLARVFRFVVDAEVDLGDFPNSPEELPSVPTDAPTNDMMTVLARLRPLKVLEADSVDVDAFGDVSSLISSEVTQTVTNYLFLSASVGGDTAPWTTAKLRYPTGERAPLAGVSGHFLPCSLEEMDLAAVVASPDRDSEFVDRVECSRSCNDANGNPRKRYILPAMRDGLLLQFDGVLDLGAGRRDADPRKRRPRYDMLSLDVVAAMESQANLVRSHRGKVGGSDSVHARPTYRSAGLLLLDRWRAAAMASARADAEARSSRRENGDAVVFDSSALTVGYRIDVGVRRKWQAGRLHNWRTLGNRVVRYSYPLQPSLIEKELARLGLPQRSEARIRMDSTPVLPGASVHGQSRFPEEILVSWEGDPLGVQIAEDPQGRSTTLDVDPAQDLAISRHYELPDEGESAYRIPKLTFGKRYRYGLRADYVGGVTAPLERARAIYEEASGGMLALPEAPVPLGGKWQPALPDAPRAKGRRFLRHERLLSPEIAIPEGEVDAARKGGKQRRLRDQSALEAVVRTARLSNGSYSTLLDTDSVTRILIPPGVSQDFAEWHGLLNRPDLFAGTRPGPRGGPVVIAADGLKNVAYDAENGGLRRRTAYNNASRQASIDAGTSRKQAPDPGDRDGDPVFVVDAVAEATASPSGVRAQRHVRRVLPFFPDPAAHSMVLALRKPGYGAGDRPQPEADPEYRNPADYVSGDPVVLDLTHPALRYPDTLVVALDVRRRPGQEARNIAKLSQQDAMPSQYRVNGWIGPNGFSAGRIDGAIAAGLVPAIQARIYLAPGEEFELDTWCLPSVEQLDRWFDVVETSAVLAIIKQCVDGSDDSKAKDGCSAGLASLLGETEVNEFDRFLREPDNSVDDGDECSAGGLPLPGVGIRWQIAGQLHNYMRSRPIPEIAAVQTIRIAHAVGKPNFAPAFRPVAAETATENMRGTGLEIIRLDPEKLGGPASSRDTAAETAEAHDTALRNFIVNNPVENWHSLGSSKHHDHATGLLVGGSIGIDLDTCGGATIYATMTHPHTATFDDVRINRRTTRIDQAPRYGFTVGSDHRIALDREDVVLVRLESLRPSTEIKGRIHGLEAVDLLFEGGTIRPARRGYQPTDYKARRMKLWLEATTRFGSDFEWAPTPASGSSASASDPGNALFNDGASWIKSSRQDRLPGGQECEIWMPATRRPDPIDPTSILPAFVWHEETGQPGTTVLTRRTVVRLRFRRPWFSSGEGERLGVVLWPPDIFKQDPTRTDFARPTDVVAQDIYDRELRDGTGYITRSGADPIRQGGAPTFGEFMPVESFRLTANNLVIPVSNVAMPLPLGPDEDPSQEHRKTLQVALLSCEPLFDPVDELWYVDLDISGRQMPDGWIRFGLVRHQPNSIAGQELSEPSVVFTQILPRRRIRVDRTQAGSITKVRVMVDGVGSLGAAEDDRIDSAAQSYAQRPVLALTVTKSRKLSDKVGASSAAEEIEIARNASGDLLEFRGTESPDWGYIQAEHGDDGLIWTKEFDLLEKSSGSVRYDLLIEEIDLRPTDWPREDGSDLAESPRFIASIMI